MIDVHCHILPGVDDGAASIDEALAMARAAQREGVKAIFATPHVARGSYDTEPGAIRSAAQGFAVHVRQAGLALAVYPGAENSPEADLPDGCRAGRVMTLGLSKFVLVEAPVAELPWLFEKLLFKLMVAGFRPVLAHPERNPTLQNDFRRLATISRTGSVLQVNARSLSGFYGSRVRAFAERIVREGHAGLIGSDAHGPRDYDGLARAREWILETGGEEALAGIVANEDALMRAVTEDVPAGL